MQGSGGTGIIFIPGHTGTHQKPQLRSMCPPVNPSGRPTYLSHVLGANDLVAGIQNEAFHKGVDLKRG